jgi:hypothetical protein
VFSPFGFAAINDGIGFHQGIKVLYSIMHYFRLGAYHFLHQVAALAKVDGA